MTEDQFIFYRLHNAAHPDSLPTRLSEKEARTLISAAGVKNVESKISKLKAGGTFFTRYGTYSAVPNPKYVA